MLPDPDWSVANGSLSAVVDRRWLVRSYAVDYRVETPDGSYTGELRVEHVALGETEVTRPNWVESDG